MKALLACLAATCLVAPGQDKEFSPFERTLNVARKALESGDLGRAETWVWAALERDPKSLEAWDLRAKWAEAAGDDDELVYTLHKLWELSVSQGLKSTDLRELRNRLKRIDPLSTDLLSMKSVFIDKLLPLAIKYEGDKRPHSAIAVYREVLALDPEHEQSLAAVERISALPDPSLAANSSGVDLFEDVSDEWIRKHDEKHKDWKSRAKYKSEYYTVYTDAGYKILIQAATAMDQMHLFYKKFFSVTGSVPRIDLNIFSSREGYLKKGIGPPVEWSGGHFTGNAVETYIGQGGFQGALNTLFHEAGHQFVDKATSAGGWLNEGLASFFEGTRLQANGTVLMNLPAMNRLGPLASRLSNGWMADVKDGIDPREPNQVPRNAPTFDIVLENKYAWGPAWYAPTWGVVFFSYNYQDPVDGRFIYRDAFLQFLNKSGGRMGGSAVQNFEDVVLANPAKPTPKVKSSIALPTTVKDLNPIWRDWLLNLMNEQTGAVEVDRPYMDWGRHAITRKEYDTAAEHFEKGIAASPNHPELLIRFAKLLADEFKNEDRAVKLVLHALRVLEAADEPDKRAIAEAEDLLYDWDPERKSLDKLHDEIFASARTLVQRYLTEGRNLMTMHLALRMSGELGVPGVAAYYEEAWRRCGKSLHLWKLAYNEKDLEGWSEIATTPFKANGSTLDSTRGSYAQGDYSFSTLPMDVVTTGDFSLEAEVLAGSGKVAFGGLAFGMRGGGNFNALIYLPAKASSGAVAGSAFLDLATFNGGGAPRVWRHVPAIQESIEGESTAERWQKLRIDVTGTQCDIYMDGELKVLHEFPSRDAVSGSLGLIAGRGEARFRNVRYLARSPQDIGAALEREVRMAGFDNEEESIGGSWIGKKPPFPKVQKWLQGERSSWKEAGDVPQLLVMWSIRQNDLIRIDSWLADLHKRYGEVGLEIVSICSVEDEETLAGYLPRAKFPGAIGLDGPGEQFGDTFDDYAIGIFNLPRLILLDINHRVVWEGDPGFSAGRRWKPGTPSYLKAPLDDLIVGRKLLELSAWRKEWKSTALDALHNGDLATALPTLLRSKSFKAAGDVDVFDAQSRLSAVKGALESIDSTISAFKREGCEPAIEILADWGKLIDHSFEKSETRSIKLLAKSEAATAWDDLLTLLKSHKRRAKREGKREALDGLLADLEARPSRLAKMLLEQLDGVDPEDVVEVLSTAADLPALWLAREYFRW